MANWYAFGMADQSENDAAIKSLFAGVNRTTHELKDPRRGHGIPSAAMPSHPSRVRAARAGMSLGRMVPASDFDKMQSRKTEGVPSIGMAPPQFGSSAPDASPVEQKRQLYGLAQNQRANQIAFNADNPVQQLIPVVQFNGTTTETDTILVQLGGPTFNVTPVGATGQKASVGFGSIAAVLQWGVGNAQFSATVDWVQGAIFSLPANYLAVTAQVPAQTNTSAMFGLTANMQAGVACSYGAPSDHRNRARLTQFLGGGVSDGSTTAFVTIPPFTTSVGIVGAIDASGLGATGTVRLVSLSNGEQWGFNYSDVTNVGRQGADVFPIPNNARQLTVTNHSGANASFYALFDICF